MLRTSRLTSCEAEAGAASAAARARTGRSVRVRVRTEKTRLRRIPLAIGASPRLLSPKTGDGAIRARRRAVRRRTPATRGRRQEADLQALATRSPARPPRRAEPPGRG